MISITTQRFLLVYSDVILQKNVFFTHVWNFALVVVLFDNLVHDHFGQFFYSIFCLFFKYSLNFQGHTLKSKLNKVFLLTSSSSNMTWQQYEHLKKTYKQCYHLHFANFYYIVIFSHFIFNIKRKLSHIWNPHKIYVLNNIFLHSWLL